ncbi:MULTISPECIES: peptidoglycan editing factor PgeF [unclassified Mesorhizobium]|uniref:peptidoglycan editing factor PgeF n=1 Tax=unclassified Mesorhizobium TaxID=325217 RepID=UPI0010924519|nr:MULTISPECIES: peptidoglycan editing factor PgeF [unclassified Mesorhizobium]TGS44025.1 peptidoglycan editing factor PgeF [Mesorhizobium sp. M8A.F.Ca.ET.182.01.1.1]TGS78386.1 peptidoglycan editing factor PgeF [Mesorhizobium sp. M8A.F.Ca.ET.181.01.1.1]TGV15556.1 peptidoglycan editing factor PgeF [Mesorhizobium sp. M8A.F.Ca.ET.173.01.1.1]
MFPESTPYPLMSASLGDAAGIRHGFFTRSGGVSRDIYAGLNIGLRSLDDLSCVLENRRRVAHWMGVDEARFLTVVQIHSNEVVVASEPFQGERPKADAIVTDRPGLAIASSTADCGPILFADAQARVIGAAHAGWRGAFSGILENTIAAMEGLGAERDRIVAVLGPSIGQENYEVGPEFVDLFLNAAADNATYFKPSPHRSHAMFDLNRYTIDRLSKSGVTAEGLCRCTFAEENLFYSYRRSKRHGEPDFGRQASSIVLQDD